MKIASVVVFIFILLASGLSVYMSTEANSVAKEKISKGEVLADLRRLKALSVQASSDGVGDTERKFIDQEYEMLMQQMSDLEKPESLQGLKDSTKIWIKLGFSVVFGLAALFVVLSRKYNEETQKWAFSTLSLLAGVWIGTIS
jgi:hypothetical protein